MLVLVKTPNDREALVASRASDAIEAVRQARPKPDGFRGLVLIETSEPIARDLLERIPEIENVTPLETTLERTDDPDAIAEMGRSVAAGLPEGSTFAVRAATRGTLPFASEELEAHLGAAILELDRALSVDLSAPDWVIQVEFLADWVGIGRRPGGPEHPKRHAKRDAREICHKTTVSQLVYESTDPQGIQRVGAALGRSAQAFEIARLMPVMDAPLDAAPLRTFLEAVDDGIRSRHEVQKRAEARPIGRVPVTVYEVYQMLRAADADASTLTLITDPKGRPLSELRPDLGPALDTADAIVLFNGAHRGIPTGCFPLADYVIDLAPRITYGTDQAITAALIGLLETAAASKA